MPNNESLTRPQPLNWDDAKVGDVICYPRYIQYGWSIYYRFPIYVTTHIARITPKRTKIICGDGHEISKKDRQEFFPITNETDASTQMAMMFKFCMHSQDIITTEKLAELSKSDLFDVYTHLKAIKTILESN